MKDILNRLDTIEETVLRILSRYATIPQGTYNETQLYRDLNLGGDDINDLFKEIEKEFDITISDFAHREYFPEERSYFALPLHWLGVRTSLHHSKYKLFSIDDLIRIVREKISIKK